MRYGAGVGSGLLLRHSLDLPINFFTARTEGLKDECNNREAPQTRTKNIGHKGALQVRSKADFQLVWSKTIKQEANLAVA